MPELSAEQFFSLFENCPLCMEFTYKDSEGREHIVYDLCEFHMWNIGESND